MSHYRVPPSPCPYCGTTEIDAAGDPPGADEPAAPRPGDWAVCFYCAEVSAFDADPRLRALMDQEKREADEDRDLQHTRRQVLAYIDAAVQRSKPKREGKPEQ